MAAAFTKPDVVQIVLDSLAFMQTHLRLTVYAFMIMENHLHVVVSSDYFSNELGDFKFFTERQIIDAKRLKGAFPRRPWEREYK
jgi:putative transposase